MVSEQKVVLITGGTQGIGLGIAKEFLKKKYFVIVCARHQPKDPIFQNDKNNILFIACDIAIPEQRILMIEQIIEKKQRLDVLVNNAGVAPLERKDLLEATEESFERVLKINLQGPYFLTQKIANYMIKIKQSNSIPNYQPCIINISSISAFTSSPLRGEYCVSKAGLSMMTKLYADRLSEYEILVYEIQPGIISTLMTEGVKEKYNKLIKEGLIPLKRWGTPEDIGKAACALANGQIPYSTGQILNLDGGFHLHRL
jgi:NAD(P)-dependent dehydrogenase (short-subunit alcohol dehydrogenase family)